MGDNTMEQPRLKRAPKPRVLNEALNDFIELENIPEEEHYEASTSIYGGNKDITDILIIHEHELLVVTLYKSNTLIYNLNLAGSEPISLDDGSLDCLCIIHVMEDLIASIYSQGIIATWSSLYGLQIDKLAINAAYDSFRSIVALSDTLLMIGTNNGCLLQISHTYGSDIKIIRQIKAQKEWICYLVYNGDILISSSGEYDVKIWDPIQLKHIKTMNHASKVTTVTANSFCIAVGCINAVYIYRCDAPGYKLSSKFYMNQSIPSSISILDDGNIFFADYVVNSTSGDKFGHLNFISVDSNSYIARIRPSSDDKEILSVVFMNRGRIAVAGENGLCLIIQPQEHIQNLFKKYSSRSIVNANNDNALVLQKAWKSVEDGSLEAVKACESFIHPEYCTKSLEEWCFGHVILMESIRRNQVSATRNYKGQNLFWFDRLYKHAAKMEMGEKDVQFVSGIFLEAEKVGVIGPGSADLFIQVVEMYKNLDKDKRFVVKAVMQLFMRQAVQDKRLNALFEFQSDLADNIEEIIQHQERQNEHINHLLLRKRREQMSSLVSAILSCVPFCGAVLANISTSATVLNDFNVHDLVDSLLGITKDTVGLSVSDMLIEKFIERSNTVFSPENWSKIPQSRKKCVEDAAKELDVPLDYIVKHFENIRGAYKNDEVPPKSSIEQGNAESRNGSHKCIGNVDVLYDRNTISVPENEQNREKLDDSSSSDMEEVSLNRLKMEIKAEFELEYNLKLDQLRDELRKEIRDEIKRELGS